MDLMFEPHTSNPERLVGELALLLLLFIWIFRYVKKMLNEPARPDPWDEKITSEISDENCPRICHRCLASHEPLANFCPECGAPVGDYTNLLPYPYLFSIGHTLRIGTDGAFKRSPLTISGFFLLAVAEYAFLAPVYWFFLLRKISNQTENPGTPLENSDLV